MMGFKCKIRLSDINIGTESRIIREERMGVEVVVEEVLEPFFKWGENPPSVEDFEHSEEYFWVRGGNFNRPVMVRANSGVNSWLVDGVRKFRAEINLEFCCEGYPRHIWMSELHRYNLHNLEWAGPVPRPEEE